MQKSGAISTLEDFKSSTGKGPEQRETAFGCALLGAGYLDDLQRSFCSYVF